jgi:hypothetical protein
MKLIVTALMVVAPLMVAPMAYAQRDWNGARDLVGRSQKDLQNISNVAALSGKERERYDNALHHLSELDQAFVHSHFDKGKLDQAVEDMDNVCKNNTLNPTERDVILGDIRELRRLKSDWKD